MPAKKWDLEKVKAEALKYSTKPEFKKNNYGAYLWAAKKGCMSVVCAHMKVVYHKRTNEQIIKDARKYTCRREWQKASASAYGAAIERGILEQACAHMEYQIKYWDKEAVLKDAQKYNTKSVWRKKSPSSYKAAKRLGIFDLATHHMELIRKRWSDQDLLDDAKRYSTRIEWQIKSESAYQLASQRGLVDKACQHMRPNTNVSGPEKEILCQIRLRHPSAQTLRDRNVLIPNKPHIKGFDIDIYIPELKKGIEFDGRYWHSQDRLVKSKPHWPIEDAINYHTIKDQHFAQKGIQILHIKEEDWLSDASKCIKMIEDFLS